MNACVVDASVAAKWFLPAHEDYMEQASTLLAACTAGDVDFLVPDFFFAEIGNVLRKAVLRQRISQLGASSALRLLQGVGLIAMPSGDLLEESLTIALQYKCTVYDCLYVALARENSCDFVTADERLANALAAYLPVKWLGAL